MGDAAAKQNSVELIHPANPGEGPLFIPGRNCWRLESCRRAAFLVDGQAYFEALATSFQKAKHRIFIAAWELDSRTPLRRDKDGPIESSRLMPFLKSLVEQRPDLRVDLLVWDYSLAFAMEREKLPSLKLGWSTPPGIRFRWAGDCPVGASHHQKLVVVDDRLAFVGGLDVTKVRWDVPGHPVDDPRRVDPSGRPYEPFHDAAVMVDGDAAAALGVLFRRRWAQAGGQKWDPETIDHPVYAEEDDPWPPRIKPDIEKVKTAISRTEPAYEDRPEVRETLQLHLDAIESAKKIIYIENQYLTSDAISRALANVLAKPSGPDVILVTHKRSTGWLEEATMDTLRSRFVERLRRADAYGRFGVFYPDAPDLPEDWCIKVHAKILIVDDLIVKIGSTNLTNRSFGLDTECDLSFQAGDRIEIAESIRLLRRSLVAEHLGQTVEFVQQAEEDGQSCLEIIKNQTEQERGLKKLDTDAPQWLDILGSDSEFVDPEQPLEADRLIARFAIDGEEGGAKTQIAASVTLLIALTGLAVLWAWTPLRDLLRPEEILSLSSRIGRSPGLLFVVGYAVAGLIMAPVSLLIGITAMVFEPWSALGIALSGCLLSATANYWAGKAIALIGLRRWLIHRARNLLDRVSDQGLLSWIILRNIPVAPFSLINLLAGAIGANFKAYLTGTALGMLPGLMTITLFGRSLVDFLTSPDLGRLSLLLLAAAVLGGFQIWIARKLKTDWFGGNTNK